MKDPYTSSLFESPNVNKSNIQNQISASGKRITRKTTALQNEDRIKLDFHSDSDIRPPESPMVVIQNMTESKPDIQNTPTSDSPSPIDDESGCSESMSESSVSSFFTWFSNLPAVPFLLSKLSFLLSIIVLCFWGISDMLWFIPNKLSKTLSLQDLHRLKTALIALLFATLCLMLLFSKNIQLNMWKKNMILDDHIKSNRENKNNNFEGLDPDIRKLMDWGYIDEHLDQQDTLPKSTKASHTEVENKVEGSKTQALDSLSNIINHTNQNDQTESKSEPKETKIESQEKEINPIPDITTEKISTSQNTNYQPDEFFNHLRESLNPISQTLILHSKILAKLQQNDISESLKSELLKLNQQSKESIKKDVANQQMYEKLMESNELLKTMMQKFEPKMEELQIKLDEFETYRGNELDQIKIDIADRLNELEGDVLNKVTELFESFKEDTEEKLENSQNNHQHFHDLGPDYSLLSAGAAIDLSYTSESYYQIGSGVPADLLHRSRPESILDPNLVPGNCWAMKGIYPIAVFKLYRFKRASEDSFGQTSQNPSNYCLTRT
ncbi:hypothetical protein BC833DRAFT_323967 [Globomyces pollinis-pini]|nr:hypothetical protein BC833DRAFT_323967 [Globomyces pollinis-pini]